MAVEITEIRYGGGISAPPPTHPGLCFAPPIPLLDPVGRIGEKNIRISGEGVYAIGASVVVGTVRDHGHFENLGRLLRLSQDLWPKRVSFHQKLS